MRLSQNRLRSGKPDYGVKRYEEAGIPFSMKGKTLRNAEPEFPVDDVAPDLIDTNADRMGVVQKAGEAVKAWPETVNAADGSTVILQNPELGSMGQRTKHLIWDNANDRMAPNKAAWIPMVPETIKNAGARLVDSDSKNRVYVRAYKDNQKHFVVVRADGVVDSQGTFTGKLITQFPDAVAKGGRQRDFVVDWERPGQMDENGHGRSHGNPAPTPTDSMRHDARQPGFQGNDPAKLKQSQEPPLFSRKSHDNPDETAVHSLQRYGREPRFSELAGIEHAPERELAKGSLENRLGIHAAKRIAAAFGKRVVFVRGKNGELSFNGFIDPAQSDVIFIAADANKPLATIAGHELAHHLERDAPDVFRSLVDALRPLVTNRAEFKEGKIALGYDADAGTMTSEFVGDLLGDRMHEPAFWEAVQKGMDAPTWKRTFDRVTNWITQAIAAVKKQGGFGSERYVTDLEAARKALADAMVKWTMKQRRMDRVAPGLKMDAMLKEVRGRGAVQMSREGDEFRRQMSGLNFGMPPKNGILRMGEVSEPLRLAGIPAGEIHMPVSVAENKPKQGNHPFPAGKLLRLPELLDDPIAVFQSESDGWVVLTDMTHKGENFVVATRLEKKSTGLEVTSISSVYPKNANGIVKWIDAKHTRYYHQEKIRNWLSHGVDRPNASLLWVQLRSTKNVKTDSDLSKGNSGEIQFSRKQPSRFPDAKRADDSDTMIPGKVGTFLNPLKGGVKEAITRGGVPRGFFVSHIHLYKSTLMDQLLPSPALPSVELLFPNIHRRVVRLRRARSAATIGHVLLQQRRQARDDFFPDVILHFVKLDRRQALLDGRGVFRFFPAAGYS